MREFLSAVVICWMTVDIAKTAYPIGSVTAEPAPIRVVTVLVCAPKDDARIPMGWKPPKLVQTERIIAANMTPLAQANEQRGKRRR